jgi:hypothetical protein
MTCERTAEEQQFLETKGFLCGYCWQTQFMNVISARTNETSDLPVCRFATRNIIAFPRQERPHWLPAPACRTTSSAIPRRPVAPNLQGSLGEKLVMGLLAVLAVSAIAYGFSCAMDLVQHWPVFNAGIERVIQ